MSVFAGTRSTNKPLPLARSLAPTIVLDVPDAACDDVELAVLVLNLEGLPFDLLRFAFVLGFRLELLLGRKDRFEALAFYIREWADDLPLHDEAEVARKIDGHAERL